MCGRFVDPNLRNTEAEFAQTKINPMPRRFNIKPTNEVYVVKDGELVWARWGLIPVWHKGGLADWKASTINARIEEVSDKPTYRDAWRSGRCLIPAGGYFEWTGDRTPKQPHLFTAPEPDQTMWFAGLVSRWQDMLTCTIMTRAANAHVEPIHDRMPVILNVSERTAWLGGSQDREIGAGAAVFHHPVRPFGIKDEGAALLESSAD